MQTQGRSAVALGSRRGRRGSNSRRAGRLGHNRRCNVHPGSSAERAAEHTSRVTRQNLEPTVGDDEEKRRGGEHGEKGPVAAGGDVKRGPRQRPATRGARQRATMTTVG